MIGRLTGSVEWREARGEMGDGVATTQHSFSPNAKDLESGYMEVSYCCSTNRYTQSGEAQATYDWQTGENRHSLYVVAFPQKGTARFCSPMLNSSL